MKDQMIKIKIKDQMIKIKINSIKYSFYKILMYSHKIQQNKTNKSKWKL